MTDINPIIKRLQENEEVTKKFHAVEAKILTILAFKDLFEILLNEIRTNFNVPYVWISMAKQSEVSSLVQSLGDSGTLKEHMNIIDKGTFLDLVGHQTAPILVNQNLKPFFKLLPRNNKFFFKSLAVAPLSLDGDIIGSLNQADTSPHRFQPGIDTTLLEQLALKVSICLSNVTAHEKLKLFAYHDGLTGLLNQQVLEKILKREVHRADRYDSPLSLAFLNLRQLAEINEVHGQKQRDAALVYFGKTLTRICRQSDIVARVGDDTFVVILPETKSRDAEEMMNRVDAHLQAHPAEIQDDPVQLGLNYGIAALKDRGVKTPEQLLKKAEQAELTRKKRSEKKRKKSSDQKVIALNAKGKDRKKT